MAVFALVLNSLPDRVKVYPTENYYYFRFIHAGTPYAGNLRFDRRDRDQGKVQFGNFAVLTTREALAAPRYDTQGLANRIFLHSPLSPIRRCLNKWPRSRSSLVHCRVARYP